MHRSPWYMSAGMPAIVIHSGANHCPAANRYISATCGGFRHYTILYFVLIRRTILYIYMICRSQIYIYIYIFHIYIPYIYIWKREILHIIWTRCHYARNSGKRKIMCLFRLLLLCVLATCKVISGWWDQLWML